MIHIHPLRSTDGPRLLELERANRVFWARSVPDRGDAFFADFDDVLERLLVMQEAGTDLFFLVHDDDDRLVGRVNLVDIEDGVAHLGYRIAEPDTGRGHATAAVGQALAEAQRRGITLVRAMTTVDNVGSRKVLRASGFVLVPGAEPAEIEGHGGRAQKAVHYERRL